jgi:hypothetical protein
MSAEAEEFGVQWPEELDEKSDLVGLFTSHHT